MLVPINQVDFEDFNWGCFAPSPTCLDDNKTMLQRLADAVCNLPDYSQVNTGCLKANPNPVDLFNALFVKVCLANSTTVTEEDLSKLIPCGLDNWTVNSDATCLFAPGTNQDELTLFQTFIKRLNTYATIIKQQDSQLKVLSQNYSTLQAQINNLSAKITNCCP